MRILVMGAGKMGSFFIDLLSFDHEVAVFERDPKRMRFTYNCQRFTHIEIHHPCIQGGYPLSAQGVYHQRYRLCEDRPEGVLREHRHALCLHAPDVRTYVRQLAAAL